MKKSEALNILGLEEGVSDDAIKKAHRKLIIENHPDKFGQDEAARAKAEEKTKLINEARDCLLSRKWDPEYSTSGTRYGAPYSYNPYTRPYSGSSNGDPQNPFAGWPFGDVNFVWTTWDQQGNPHTYRSGQGQSSNSNDPFSSSNPFGKAPSDNPFSSSNPFTGSIPFDFSPFAATITPEEMLSKEKGALGTDIASIAIKILALVLSCIFGLPALGFYLYVVISVGFGIYKRFSAFSALFLVPFLLMAFTFVPLLNGPVSIFLMALFLLSLGFDLNNLRGHIRKISTLKQKISHSEKKND